MKRFFNNVFKICLLQADFWLNFEERGDKTYLKP